MLPSESYQPEVSSLPCAIAKSCFPLAANFCLPFDIDGTNQRSRMGSSLQLQSPCLACRWIPQTKRAYRRRKRNFIMKNSGTGPAIRTVLSEIQTLAAKASGDNQAVLNGMISEFDHLAEWGGDNSITREEILTGLKMLAEKTAATDNPDIAARRKAMAQIVAAANYAPPTKYRYGLATFASALANALAMAAESKKSAHPNPAALQMAAMYPREIGELISAALS